MNKEDIDRLALKINEAQRQIDSAIACMSTNEHCDEHPTPNPNYSEDGEPDPHEHPPCAWCNDILEEAYQLLRKIKESLDEDAIEYERVTYVRLDPNKPAPDLADEFPEGTF